MSLMEERITELELRYTEQQAALQALSDVVYGQQKSIDLLEAQLAVLRKRVEAEPGLVDAKADERPPHY
jgi:SlyX protein